MENTDLKYLKKHYGEKFAHLCRELFPTILENEGMLSKIISNNFADTRSLYEDILPTKEKFKAFILSKAKINESVAEEEVTKTPEELMDEAGYILYPECQSEKDIQSFKKYWAKGEELCTFRGGRLADCRVWFAVKKNIDQIKRENFTEPKRQDEYGTSAISIQFTKGNRSTLSIKNRYNHTVNNPDATYSNNLDNIIPGLTQSFVKTYGINLMKDEANFYFPDYYIGDDGKLYRVNVEDNGVMFCDNNRILLYGNVVEFNKARYILAEKYLIDKQEKTIKLSTYRNFEHEEKDAFIDSIGEIKDMTFKTDEKGNRVVVCTPKKGEDVEITLNERNEIIGYKNPNVTEIGDKFLSLNKSLQKLELPNLTKVGRYFLMMNRELQTLSLPKLISANSYFLLNNKKIADVYLPELKYAGVDFLSSNMALEKLSLPNLEKAEMHFLSTNIRLASIELPKLREVGEAFLVYNDALQSISLPSLQFTGDGFLNRNQIIEEVYLPNLKIAGNLFMTSNQALKNLNLPNLISAGFNFLKINDVLKNINLPKLENAERGFLACSEKLRDLALPNLKNQNGAFRNIDLNKTEESAKNEQSMDME